MLNDIIERLKQFEVILKKCILDRFGTNLPQNKIDIINNTSYVDENIMNGLKNGNEIQGRILRHMLDSIISFKCNKDFVLKNNTKISVPYGEDIEKELIELYASEIAQKYKFNIDYTTLSLEKANSLREILGDTFDFSVLNLNCEVVLDNPNLSLFATNYNNEILQKYENEPPATIKVIDLSNNNGEGVINNSYVEEPVSSEADSILTDEEYQELCMKYARNEVLTQEEFTKLLKGTPELLNENTVEDFSNHNVSVINNDHVKKLELGFASPSLALYLFSIFIAFLIVLGIILF